MTFLNSALWPALAALLGLPLLIHLLNLQFPKLFEFPTVRHLRKTVAQRSRLYRWRHRILLLLRTLFVLALLLAFLKPLLPRLGSPSDTKAARTVLIVIDHSMSMEHKEGGVTARQRSQAEAAKILDTLTANDSVNILLAGRTPETCFVDFSRNHDEARRFVDNLRPGLAHTDLSQMNAAAGRLLARDPDQAEVYYVSDFQRKSWAGADFTALPPRARFFFIDVGAPNRPNRAILRAALNQSQILAGDTVTLEVEVGNFQDQPLREPLKVIVDGRSTIEKDVVAAPWATAQVSVPVPAGAPGLHLCEVALPPDDLPYDDRFHLTIPVLEKEGVLIVSDAPEAGRDGVLYLKTALNPYENQGGSILPQQIHASELTAARLASVRKLFFTRTARLDEATCKLVADFVFHGGGMAYFLDGDSDPENLADLERAMAAPLPLKAGKKRIAQNVGAGAQQILRGDFKSRFLRIFRGEHRQNLALLEFYDITEASATGAGQVLLRYADETPAMASLNHGLGTILLMNFSVSELSSNIARQRVFPAWMHEIVKNLTADEPVPTSAVIGQPVNDEVWKRELQQAPLTSPSGSPVFMKAEPLGERAAISFVPNELGVFTMAANRLLHAYAVNASPDECDLRAIDRGVLPDQLTESGKRGYVIAGKEDLTDLVHGRPILHWCLFGALALLAAEQLFQLLVRRPAR